MARRVRRAPYTRSHTPHAPFQAEMALHVRRAGDRRELRVEVSLHPRTSPYTP